MVYTEDSRSCCTCLKYVGSWQLKAFHPIKATLQFVQSYCTVLDLRNLLLVWFVTQLTQQLPIGIRYHSLCNIGLNCMA